MRSAVRLSLRKGRQKIENDNEFQCLHIGNGDEDPSEYHNHTQDLVPQNYTFPCRCKSGKYLLLSLVWGTSSKDSHIPYSERFSKQFHSTVFILSLIFKSPIA